MFATPLRYCGPIKNINGVLAIGNGNIGQIVTNITRKPFSDKGKCCKDTPQTEGRKVEPWPKMEPPPSCWRSECPRDPQPPNYDPYRIKVPEVVVPPLPPSNAKPFLECAKSKSPCSPAKAPDPPPCPPPPHVPFNWFYIWVTGSFLALMGLIYKFYLWQEQRQKVKPKPIFRARRKVKKPNHEQDLPPCVQYLIVGTGAAGWAAYQAIQEHDPAAKVFFVTKEDSLPYVRPPLSKHMWWNKEPPDINTLYYVKDGRRFSMYLAGCDKFMDPVKFYRKKTGPAVSMASGWCVVRVDADDHVVFVRTTCGEYPIYYERAVLALGAKAKNLNLFKSAPKPVRDKVSTMRTIRDLELAFRHVRESKHVVIIGGGALGVELAWHLGKMNEVVEREEDEDPIQFTHIYKDRGVLAGIVPEYLGEWAAELIACEHVALMPSTQVYDAFMTKDGRLELTLSNGSSIVTDYVLVAVGTEARTEMAECSFLETDPINGGFLVNTEMEARTHLYVAGDAASIYSQWKDSRMRFEHYTNAEETGYIAGANMTGHWVPSNMEPHFWLKLGDALNMEVVGEVGACMPTIALYKPCEKELQMEKAMPVADGAGDKPCFKKSEEYKNKYKRGMLFYLRDETVVGIAFWNVPPVDDRYEVVTEMLRAKPSYKDINLLAELLGWVDTQCTYKPPDEEKVKEACITRWRVF